MRTFTSVGILLGTGIVGLTLGIAGGKTVRAQDASATVPMSSGRPHPLQGVSAIIEADIVSAQYTYDNTLGPRVQLNLANIVVDAGVVPKLTTLSQFGGPLPDGTTMRATDLPVLTPGSRYVLFLGKDPWFYTPVWSYLAFRLENIAGQQVVVGPTGKSVLSISSDGVKFGQTSIVDYTGAIDPISVLPRLATASATTPDIAQSLSRDSFIASAQAAAVQVGARFDVPIPVAPDLLGRPVWNVVQGVPAVVQ